MSYRVRFMYHPSLWVRDREEARAFFARVFGREAIAQEDFFHKWAVPGYPNNYCIWAMVADVWIDCIDPANYVIDGRQIFPSIDEAGRLQGWGWYVDGMEAIYAALRQAGVAMEDQLGHAATGEKPPSTVASSSYYPLFMAYLDEGMRYEFIQHPGAVPGVATNKVAGVDERLDPAWAIPPVAADDPLGIVRCSHHVVLTGDLDRARRLLCDVLHGTVVRSGRNALLGADSIFFRVGDDLFEYVVPSDEGTPAWDAWVRRGRNDTYHSIAFRVADLDKTAAHLAASGVGIAARDGQTVIADAATALGVPWTFTTVDHHA